MSGDMLKAIEIIGNNFKPMDTSQSYVDSDSKNNNTEDEVFKKMLEKEVEKIKSEGAKNKVNRHFEICKMLNETYRKKNHDYGDSFGKTFSQWGISSAGVRLSDKFNRFCSLASGKEQMVNDESIKDTLLDMANYCIMTYMELENE